MNSELIRYGRDRSDILRKVKIDIIILFYFNPGPSIPSKNRAGTEENIK